MATSAISSSSTSAASTAASIAATNKANAQKIISSLGAGSGVDVTSLAQNLVDAERTPKETAINAKISKNEARVSGYSAISFMMNELKNTFTKLKDKKSFNTVTTSNSNTNAVAVTASTLAVAGTHEVSVNRIAKAQRSVSAGFALPTTQLNNGSAMSISFTVGDSSVINPSVVTTQGTGASSEVSSITFKDMVAGQTVTVAGLTFTATGSVSAAQVAAAFSGAAANSTPSNTSTGNFSGVLTGFSAGVNGASATLDFTSTTSNSDVTDIAVSAATRRVSVAAGKDTPQDLVDAINVSGGAVKAQLVNTGQGSVTPYQIVLTGATGGSNAFSIAMNYGAGTGSPGVTFPVGRSGNQEAVDSQMVVDGITYTRATNTVTDAVQGLSFDLKETTSTAAVVTLTRDVSGIKDAIKSLVTNYKDATDILTEVANPKSTLDTYGATLVGDSTVRSLRQQVRSIFTGSSSTAGATVGSWWQLGLKIDEKGVMTLDETKLDAALANNFDDVVKSFTGNYDNLSIYSPAAAGFAGDAVKKLSNIVSAKGALLTNSDNATKENVKFKDDLTKLQSRMDNLLARYTKQFSTMNTLVGNVNSQKTSLKSTFDGMMAMYSNK